MIYLKKYEGIFNILKKNIPTEAEKDPKKIEIINICKEYNIINYTINDDYTIDVDSSVDISYKNLYKIPIKFRRVSGYFWCVGNFLENLENSPIFVGGNFMCQKQYNGSLKSLKGAPKTVVGRFDCQSNTNLKSFEFISNIESGTIELQNTGIYSFDFLQDNIKYFYSVGTPLHIFLTPLLPIVPNTIELIKLFDPIRPNGGDKPIILIDRYEGLLEELGKEIPKKYIESFNNKLLEYYILDK